MEKLLCSCHVGHLMVARDPWEAGTGRSAGPWRFWCGPSPDHSLWGPGLFRRLQACLTSQDARSCLLGQLLRLRIALSNAQPGPVGACVAGWS